MIVNKKSEFKSMMDQRTKKYKLKLDPEIRGKTYDRLKPFMVKNQAAYQVEAVKVEEEVRTVLCEVNVLDLVYYIIFAKEVLKVLRKHTDQTAEREINILINKWCDRGLHPINLYRILRLYVGMVCRVQIWDGTDTATVTPEGWLDVKTHTPDNCFAADYAGGQVGTVIITPPAGKRIEIVTNYVSTEDAVGDITLKFTGAAQPFFKLYTKTKTEAVGNLICAKGNINQTVEVTCPAKTFISIGYDILD